MEASPRRNLPAAYRRIIDRTAQAAGGCLICTYSTGSHGYAQAWDGQTVVLAHRIVWEYHHGPIAPGMTVDHVVCRNRRCVNVHHLRLIGKRGCIRGHDPSWWRAKGPTRAKGHCHACRMIRQAERRGYTPRIDYNTPSISSSEQEMRP